MTWLTAEPAEMLVPGTCLGIGLATAALAGGAGLPYGAPAKLRVIAHPHGRSRPRREVLSCISSLIRIFLWVPGSGLRPAPGRAGYTARAGEMGNLVGEAG